MNSTVMIHKFTGANTEIAKNLALTAINIILFDPRLITQEAIQTNFLFPQRDESTLPARFDNEAARILGEMNPFIKITVLEELGLTAAPRDLSNPTCCLEVLPLDLSKYLVSDGQSSQIEAESPNTDLTWRAKLHSVSFFYRFLAYFQPEETVPSIEKAFQMVLDGSWDAPELRELFLSLQTPSILELLESPAAEQCPVYSVGGSILSQEVVTFIKDPSKAVRGWIYYDALAGSARVFNFQQTESSGTATN